MRSAQRGADVQATDRLGQERRSADQIELSRTVPVGRRKGGTLSVAMMRSIAGSANASAAPSMNRPWATQAITCRLPPSNAARAARTNVPPVLMRSSTTMQVASRTLADEKVAGDHPGAAVASRRKPCRPVGRWRLPAPDGRGRRASPPPRSGETTQSGSSPISGRSRSTSKGAALSATAAAAEGVLEGALAVHLESDHRGLVPIASNNAAIAARRHRVVGLGATILSCVT